MYKASGRKMSKVLAPVIVITFLVQLIAFFIGVGNNIILSRWLGPGALGIFASIIVIIEIIYKIVNPGLDTSAIYFISNRKFNFKNYVSTYFINGFLIFLLGLFLLFVLSNLRIFTELFDKINLSIVSENFFGVSFYFLSFLLYEFGVKVPLGLQQFKSYNKIQIIKPVLLFILLIIGSNYFNAKIDLVLIITGVSFIIPSFFYWRWALPLEAKWNRENTKASVNYGLKVMLGSILQYLIYRADILLIGFFLTQTEVGWYYVSVLIAERLLFLTQATATVLLPAASSSEEHRDKTPLLSRLNFTVVFIGSVIIGISAYWIIPFLFSEDYSNSVLPLVIILPGIICLSVSKLLSADLSARGLPQYSLYVSILNFLLNISLNFILIPNIGIAGAALSSSVSYSAALFYQVYLYKKITGISFKELMLIKKGDLKKLKFV
jgi:O-antigen/teichoic acid export membrane protein